MGNDTTKADSFGKLRGRDTWPIALVVALFLLFFAAVVNGWWPLGSNPALRGQFGDSFGVLSSLFNGLAFAGLIITIILQSRQLELQRYELIETRKELIAQKDQLEYQSFAMAKQNFESTFFRILKMIDERASAIPDPVPGELSRRGRSGFTSHVRQLMRTERGNFNDQDLQKDAAEQLYGRWFQSAAPELSSYFQLILEALRFVDQTKVSVQKASYVSFLSAALSPAEMELLFYHGIFGENRAELSKLLLKYKLFEKADGTTRSGVPDARLPWYDARQGVT